MDEQNQLINTFYAARLNDGSWRTRLINRAYYEHRYNTTEYEMNRYYYASLLAQMEALEEQVIAGCPTTTEDRCDNITLCGGANMIIIDCATGQMTFINETPTCSGGGGVITITTVYNGGELIWEATPPPPPGNNWPGWNQEEDDGLSGNFNGNNNPNDPHNGGGGGGNICQGSSQMQISNFDDIIAALDNFINTYNLSTTAYDLLNVVQPECIGVSDFAGCMAASMMCTLAEEGDCGAFEGLELEPEEAIWLYNNPTIREEMGDFICEKDDEYAQEAIQSVINLIVNGWLEGPYAETEREAIIAEYSFSPNLYPQYVVECIILRFKHPTWGDWRISALAHWNVMTGYVHTALDLCGLAPLAGEVCDMRLMGLCIC